MIIFEIIGELVVQIVVESLAGLFRIFRRR